MHLELIINGQKNEIINGQYEEDELKNEPYIVHCVNCNHEFDDLKLDQVIFLEKCAHVICKDCITDLIKDHFPDVECPEKDCA